MANRKFYYPVTIREHHLDTFGHMNNATYLELFEEARWQLITENGFGLKDVLEEKKGPVVLDVYLKFRKEIRLREEITIETICSAYRGKIGKVHQEMRNSKGALCCVGEFSFGLFDLTERKLVDPTERWLKAIGVEL